MKELLRGILNILDSVRILIAEDLLNIAVDIMPECKEKRVLIILLSDYLIEVYDNGRK